MSVAEDVADAVAAAVTGLAWAGVSVKRRKTPSLPQKATGDQVVIVAGDEEYEDLTATQKLVTVPVGVVYFSAGGETLADDDAVRDRMEAVRRAIDDRELTTFAGVTGFDRATVGGKPPWDAGALAKNVNAAALVFRVEVTQTKAT